MNPSTALATVLVDELLRCGLREAVLAPGSRSAPLALALQEADVAGRLRLHVRIDERSAGYLALGLAKASGVPVPVVTTSGTAAANLHPAVLEADQSGVPLVLLTADRPPELRSTGANQTIDQVKLFGDAVRMFAEVGVPARVEGQTAYWRALTGRAWAAARGTLTGDPGRSTSTSLSGTPWSPMPTRAGRNRSVADRTAHRGRTPRPRSRSPPTCTFPLAPWWSWVTPIRRSGARLPDSPRSTDGRW